MYYKQVDKRYRETIVKFLKKHFRYNYVELRIMPSVTKLMLFKRWISRLGHPSLGIIRCARCRCKS